MTEEFPAEKCIQQQHADCVFPRIGLNLSHSVSACLGMLHIVVIDSSGKRVTGDYDGLPMWRFAFTIESRQRLEDIFADTRLSAGSLHSTLSNDQRSLSQCRRRRRDETDEKSGEVARIESKCARF